MSQAHEWIFSGIGTSIISFIVGVIFGSTGGIHVYKKLVNKQKQKAGDDSNQFMIGAISKKLNNKNSSSKRKTKNSQHQKAGKNSTQIMIGEADDD